MNLPIYKTNIGEMLILSTISYSLTSTDLTNFPRLTWILPNSLMRMEPVANELLKCVRLYVGLAIKGLMKQKLNYFELAYFIIFYYFQIIDANWYTLAALHLILFEVAPTSWVIRIFSTTVFPLTSAGSQISATPSYTQIKICNTL